MHVILGIDVERQTNMAPVNIDCMSTALYHAEVHNISLNIPTQAWYRKENALLRSIPELVTNMSRYAKAQIYEKNEI